MLAQYPSTLPDPLEAPFKYLERRLLSSLPGPQKSRATSMDAGGTQTVEFCFSHSELAIFEAWSESDLILCGSWFETHWKSPSGASSVCRFIGEPFFPIYYQNYGWHVSAVVEVRGRGELPTSSLSLPIWIWLRGVTLDGDPVTRIYDYSTNHRTVNNATGSPFNSTVLINPDTGGSVDMTAANTSLTTSILPTVFYTTGTWRVLATIRKANIPVNPSNDGSILLADAQWDEAVHGTGPADLDRRGLYLTATSTSDGGAIFFRAEGYTNISGNFWFVSESISSSSFGEWIDIEIERYNSAGQSFVRLKLDGVLYDTSAGVPQGIGGTAETGAYAPELPRALTINRQNIFTVPSPETYSAHVLGELKIDIDGYVSPAA
jgi:hypothetical protein